MPTTRRKTLFLYVPFGLILGIFAVASEVKAHGLSAGVLAGLIGGGFAGAAILALVLPRWNRPRSPEEKRQTRQAWLQTRPLAVSAGLLAGGVASAIGAVAGGSAAALGSFALVACGVLFLVGAGLVGTMAVTRGDLWE